MMVQRYKLEVSSLATALPAALVMIAPSPTGEWVTWADYQRLVESAVKTQDEMQAHIRDLREQIG